MQHIRRSSLRASGQLGARGGFRAIVSRLVPCTTRFLSTGGDIACSPTRYGVPICVRTLAYVYLEDGTFVNTWLVEHGYAMVTTVPPNVKHQKLFLKLQREAREAKRKKLTPGDQPQRDEGVCVGYELH